MRTSSATGHAEAGTPRKALHSEIPRSKSRQVFRFPGNGACRCVAPENLPPLRNSWPDALLRPHRPRLHNPAQMPSAPSIRSLIANGWAATTISSPNLTPAQLPGAPRCLDFETWDTTTLRSNEAVCSIAGGIVKNNGIPPQRFKGRRQSAPPQVAGGSMMDMPVVSTDFLSMSPAPSDPRSLHPERPFRGPHETPKKIAPSAGV